MADHDEFDWVVARLTAADPSRSGTPRSADDPAARALLQEVLMSESPAAGSFPVPAAAFPPPATEPVEWYVPGPEPARRPRRTGRVLVGSGLAMAAAGAAALVVVNADGGGPSSAAAAAQVKQAAQASSEASVDAVRLSADFELGSLAGAATFTTVGDDMAVAVTLDDTAEPDPADDATGWQPPFLAGGIEWRVIGGVTYLRLGDGTWQQFAAGADWSGGLGAGGFGVDVDEFELDDLRSAFAELESLTDAEQVGTETIDGDTVTHYRGELTLDEGRLADWPGGMPGLDDSMPLTVDLYVDDDELLRRATATGTDVEVSVDLEYGADITIATPETTTTFELPDFPLGPDGPGFPDLSEFEDMPWAEHLDEILEGLDIEGLDDLESLDPGALEGIEGLDDLDLEQFEGWFDESFDATTFGDFGAMAEALRDLAARRPGLCMEAMGSGGGTGNPIEEWVSCLRAEGEDAAADAIESALG